MLKKLPLAILAASTVTAAMAADNFSLNNAVDAVVIQDNVWTNPAALSNTNNQVAVAGTNGGSATGGVVFEFAGQKLGLHVGRLTFSDFEWPYNDAAAILPNTDFFTDNQFNGNQSLDLFAANALGGFHFGYNQFTISNLATTTVDASGSNDIIQVTEEAYVYERGPNKLSAVVDTNQATYSFSELTAKYGSINQRGGFTVEFRLPTHEATKEIKYTGKVEGPGGTTTHVREELNTSTNTFSFGVDAGFKQFFSRTFFVSGSAGYESLGEEATRFGSSTINGTVTADKTFDESTDITIRAQAGFGGIIRKGPSVFKYTQELQWVNALSEVNAYFDEDEDSADKDKGIETTTNVSIHNFSLPFAASAEVAAGPKWTWRAGIEANLAAVSFGKITEMETKTEGTAQVPDKTYTLGKPFELDLIDYASADFGVGYKATEDFEINTQFEASNNDLFGRVSASYSF